MPKKQVFKTRKTYPQTKRYTVALAWLAQYGWSKQGAADMLAVMYDKPVQAVIRDVSEFEHLSLVAAKKKLARLKKGKRR